MLEYNQDIKIDRTLFAGKRSSTCTFEIYEEALKKCNFKYYHITDGTDNPSQETLAEYHAAKDSFIYALTCKEFLLIKYDDAKTKNKIIRMWNDASPDETDDTRKW
jgi:hypothetical protein